MADAPSQLPHNPPQRVAPLEYHQPLMSPCNKPLSPGLQYKARQIRQLIFLAIWLIISGFVIFFLIRMFNTT
jgi:hypothetical protein